MFNNYIKINRKATKCNTPLPQQPDEVHSSLMSHAQWVSSLIPITASTVSTTVHHVAGNSSIRRTRLQGSQVPIQRTSVSRSSLNALQYTRVWQALSFSSRPLPSAPQSEVMGTVHGWFCANNSRNNRGSSSAVSWLSRKRPSVRSCTAICSSIQKRRVRSSNCDHWLQKKSTSRFSAPNGQKSKLSTSNRQRTIAGSRVFESARSSLLTSKSLQLSSTRR